MATGTTPDRRVRGFDALRHRDFRLLWSGQTVSLVGDAAFLTALGWKTFTVAGSARFGVVLVCQSIAMLATTLVGGALGDRYPRRRMMVASDLARFVCVGVLAVLDATGHLSFASLLVLATLVGLGDGFFTPAFGGIVPLVVDSGSLASANSLIGVARWSSLLIGPSIAALVYGAAGSSVVFGLDALSFVVSAALLLRARPRLLELETHEAGMLGQIAAGARYVARVPWLWVTISLFGVVLMLQLAPQQVLLPKLVKEHFHHGVGAYGLLMSMVGVGTIVGTVLFGQLQPRRRRGVISYALWIANSAAIAGMALSPWFGLSIAFAAARGFCIGFAVAVWETMLMQLVPEHLLSRVVSLDWFGSFGLMPIGLAVAAGVSGLAAPGTIIGVGAGISACLFAVALTRPWLRAVD
jgi:MFS family permease